MTTKHKNTKSKAKANKTGDSHPPKNRPPNTYFRFEVYVEGEGLAYKSTKLNFEDAVKYIKEQHLKILGRIPPQDNVDSMEITIDDEIQ